MTRRRHFFRNLRTAMFLAAAGIIVAGGAALWWANRTGLPETWRATIERELAKQGANVTIDSLSYAPFQGLIASGVRIFSDRERLDEISRLERVVLDFDTAGLVRKNFRLKKIELSDARLSMPVDPLQPDSTRLEITDLNGTVTMPGGQLLEVNEVRGKIAGIEVVFGARMLGYQQLPKGRKNAENERKRREIAKRVICELEKWEFARSRPPVLRIFVAGDLSDPSTLGARVSLQAREVGKNGYSLNEISAEGELIGDLFELNSLHASDSRGEFDGRLDYDLKAGEGRFDLVSSLEIPGLLKAWAGVAPPSQISFAGRQQIEAEGDFQFAADGKPDVRVTGGVKCDSVLLRGQAFDELGSAFSWRNGSLFLRDLSLSRNGEAAKGKALVQGPLVQLAIQSSLPTKVLLPLFEGQPLALFLKDFGTLTGAKVDVSLEGGFDMRDRTAWAYTGRGQVDHVSFRGVPVVMAKTKFSVNHHELDFFEGTVAFDYRDYALRDAFDGPERGTAKVGRVRFDAAERQVEIEQVEGTIWAAPMVRLFAPKIADFIENYRFHRPPLLQGSGVVDVTPQGRTDLAIQFSSERPADYKFLGKKLTLGKPSGQVVIQGDKVIVNNLKVEAFDGPVAARFNQSKNRLAGELSWTHAGLAEIGATYGFEMKGGGSTTGRIEFDCTDGKIETLNGEGLLALEKTELFSVPMFGPLSALVAGALGDRQAGYQQAKDAFMNFQIHKGVLSSNDFRTTTSSLVFTGDGNIDLANRNIDMTVRMNARGFLGLITLPLRPFYGLFQFHGTGPMRTADWKAELFSAPPDGQKEALLNPPKARVVQEN